MKDNFIADYPAIIKKIQAIDPIAYGKSRNYIDGAVTYLSPYISRGVISTTQVLQIVLKKGYQLKEIESFVKELCWRDYFQRVAQVKSLDQELRQPQADVNNYFMPLVLSNATSGIEGIDNAVEELYKTGYMHNHCRMYVASLVCNIGKSHWLLPARWMYYNLLDGDWASNACSWQWVADANSGKKYYANQENINKFTRTNQQKTFLDLSYEELETAAVPHVLQELIQPVLKTKLPPKTQLVIDNALPSFIYNYYNLDPQWHEGKLGNRILILDPEFFAQYPVSEKCINFAIELSKNIPSIQIYIGSFTELFTEYNIQNIYFKEHPFNVGYTGHCDARDWIVPEVSGYFPSFFSYWKKVEKHLLDKHKFHS